MDWAIKAENLGKKYLIRHQTPARYASLRDEIGDAAARLFRRGTRANKRLPKEEYFWALDGVSFEVKTGQRVGIIGRNGAGKSTLLKILSRITYPSEGRVRIRGRVSSLLEVGTGFHPELTGRENIFLNGVILGMRSSEIRRRFDEIVDFSGVERFLDTPVKRYSSGMQVRLAFSVAAHLEPEILIVDEVLAVGDAEFQRKCMTRMESAASEGRTVLFVSHNMNAVRQLCTQVILLEAGRVAAVGPAEKICQQYLSARQESFQDSALRDQLRNLPPDPVFELDDVNVTQNGEPVATNVVNGEPISVKVTYRLKETVLGLRVYVDICDEYGDLIMRSFHDDRAKEVPEMPAGRYISELTLPDSLFVPGNFTLYVKAGIYRKRHTIPEAGIEIPLQVAHTSSYNRAYPGDPIRGKLCLPLKWTVTRMN